MDNYSIGDRVYCPHYGFGTVVSLQWQSEYQPALYKIDWDQLWTLPWKAGMLKAIPRPRVIAQDQAIVVQHIHPQRQLLTYTLDDKFEAVVTYGHNSNSRLDGYIANSTHVAARPLIFSTLTGYIKITAAHIDAQVTTIPFNIIDTNESFEMVNPIIDTSSSGEQTIRGFKFRHWEVSKHAGIRFGTVVVDQTAANIEKLISVGFTELLTGQIWYDDARGSDRTGSNTFDGIIVPPTNDIRITVPIARR